MKTVTRFTTIPIPMPGFEEDVLEGGTFGFYLDNLQKLITSVHVVTELAPTTRAHLQYDVLYPGTSVLRKVPQEPAIELFRLPADPEQVSSFATEKRSEEVERDLLDALHCLTATLSLETFKAKVRGESTRTFDFLAIPHHGASKKLRPEFFAQRLGRATRITHVRQPAQNDPPAAAWEKRFKKLYDFLGFEEGWNGDDAPPPDGIAVYNASKFLKALREANVEPTRLAASAMGGVAITRKVGTKKVLVECYNDGRVYYLFSDRTSGDMNVKQLLLDQDSLTRFIASMREYLNG